MGHPGFNRQWAAPTRASGASTAAHGRGRGRRGRVGRLGGPGRPGHAGPPPWVAGLFGLGQGEQRRGPRVRRGDVRSAILDVLRSAAETRRAGQRLPGHPADRRAQRRRLAAQPRLGLPDHPAAPGRGAASRPTTSAAARPCASPTRARPTSPSTPTSSPPSGGRSTGADREDGRRSPTSSPRSARSWARCGRSSPRARRASSAAAIDVLVDTRRKLYGILADGDEADDDEDDDERDRVVTEPAADQRRRARARGGRPGRALRPGPADRRRARRAARAGLGRPGPGASSPRSSATCRAGLRRAARQGRGPERPRPEPAGGGAVSRCRCSRSCRVLVVLGGRDFHAPFLLRLRGASGSWCSAHRGCRHRSRAPTGSPAGAERQQLVDPREAVARDSSSQRAARTDPGPAPRPGRRPRPAGPRAGSAARSRGATGSARRGAAGPGGASANRR